MDFPPLLYLHGEGVVPLPDEGVSADVLPGDEVVEGRPGLSVPRDEGVPLRRNAKASNLSGADAGDCKHQHKDKGSIYQSALQ